jgi:hypothetical protein
MQAGPEQKKPNRRARCMQPPSGYKRLSTFAQTSRRKGGQPCRRHATAPSRRTSPTPNTPSMEAQAHTSCNRRAECFVHATAPPLAPPPRLLDCGTNTVTRGDPAHDPAAPAWRDGQCGQKWPGSNGGGRRAGAAVASSAKLTSHPGGSERTLPHGVKTTRSCSAPRTARARATATSRTTRPVALTPWWDRRRLWQEKRATLRLRHNGHVKKRYAASFDFVSFSFFPLSLSCNRDRERGIPRKGSFPVKEPGSEPPY